MTAGSAQCGRPAGSANAEACSSGRPADVKGIAGASDFEGAFPLRAATGLSDRQRDTRMPLISCTRLARGLPILRGCRRLSTSAGSVEHAD